MGNKVSALGVQCSTNKSQVLFEASADIVESADEWLGRGLLVPATCVDSCELRLPVMVGDLPKMRVCKRIARRPREDEASDTAALSASGSARPVKKPKSGAQQHALESASREYALHFLQDLDKECKAVEVFVSDSAGLLNLARAEKDVTHVASIVSSYCTRKEQFAVTVRVEIGSVGFKRFCSPFRDPRNVEELVKRALEPHDRGQVDLPTFAANYGNCIVEKAFCGGVMCLRFRRSGSLVSTGDSGPHDVKFDIQVGRDTFSVIESHRGGANVLSSYDGKKGVPLELVEKQVHNWCKSLDLLTRNAREVVRLKLSAFSKVEGMNVPGALTRMDFDHTAMAERAKESLVRAGKTRSLPLLREAVDQADAASLDDPSLPELRALRRRLDAASEALQKATRLGDVEALRKALKTSEDAGYPDWERAIHEEAENQLNDLETAHHCSALEAATVAARNESSLKGDGGAFVVGALVDALRDASDRGYTALDEFGAAQIKLAEVVHELAGRAQNDALPLDQALACAEALQDLPEGPTLARANLAASQFASAVQSMETRAEGKRDIEKTRTKLEGRLRELTRDVEAARGGPNGKHEELSEALREASRYLDADASAGSSLGGETALHRLRTQGETLLQEKSNMDRTARQVEARLREACLAETSSPEALEVALREVDVKHSSGALHRDAVAASAVDSARRQLLALLKPELERHLSQAASASATPMERAEELDRAKQVHQRIETHCRSICPDEVASAASRCEEIGRSVEADKSRMSSHDQARERLKHAHSSGEPECLAKAMEEARVVGLPETDMLEASARLRELQAAERNLQSALDAGDRVHLSMALEEAMAQKLRTQTVDRAQQTLQSSKTSALVSAIKSRDYLALGNAIREAEGRNPDEVKDIDDVLAQAKEEYEKLDVVAKQVSAALGTFSYDDIKSSVGEARLVGVLTEDVRKAETVLAAMDQALERLATSARQEPRELAVLQEGLHSARQQGLQAHPVYQEAEQVFQGICVPAGMVWSLKELREIWVVLCLRRLPSGADGGRGADVKGLSAVTHPLPVVVAELCHSAQVSPEAEPYPVQYIHHALARLTRGCDKKLGAVGGMPVELQEALLLALNDFSQDPDDGPPTAGHDSFIGLEGDAQQREQDVGAQQLNRVGQFACDAGLDSTAMFVWWLVCIVEWDTGQRVFVASMSEQALRVADLVNEAESTGRSLRTQLISMQASGATADGMASPLTGEAASVGAEERIAALRAVLEDIDIVRKEGDKLQANILNHKSNSAGVMDLKRILNVLRTAKPKSLEEARDAMQMRLKEASGQAREICSEAYSVLEAKMLQCHYRARQALDGEEASEPPARAKSPVAVNENKLEPRSLAPTVCSPCIEAAASIQDHAFLQLLGVPAEAASAGSSARPSQRLVDRCFQRVEVYDRFSEGKSGTIEDEFENLCRRAVAEARQRCGGRRLVAWLKPLLVDLVKRRQRLSSILNTMRNCGLDNAERALLRKHLQPRDLLVALTFSSMSGGPSQARMLSLAAKTDSPLPLLFGWAQPQGSAGSDGGLQLCTQIHWAAMRELFCSPTYPLVLSLGTRDVLGKSYLLQYLYALQECHVRGSTTPPLRIHAMPSIDIIGDFAREDQLRGVTLADVHSYEPSEELCAAMTAALTSFASLLLLHLSHKVDFSPVPGRVGEMRPSPALSALLATISVALPRKVSKTERPLVVLLFRDVDEETALDDKYNLAACVKAVQCAFANGGAKEGDECIQISPFAVPPLLNLGPQELGNEVKSLRKSQVINAGNGRGGLQLSLEEALASAVRSSLKFPSEPVLRDRCTKFSETIRKHSPNAPALPTTITLKNGVVYGDLAERVFHELESVGPTDGLLRTLFPVTLCHQSLTALLQQKVRCLNRGKEYLEPDERRRLEETMSGLEKQIDKLRKLRRQTSPHPLLKTFAQLVLLGEVDRLGEFGAYLDDWKQSRRAPLLDNKLRLRKELDQLLEDVVENSIPSRSSVDKAAPRRNGAAPRDAGGIVGADAESGRIAELRAQLVDLQRRLDEVDVSTDSFWLELMLWHEMGRIGARRGLKEIDERLSLQASKAAYLSWVKNGHPVHFLHSAPLQFGSFDPLRWHPQLSGASLFGSDFIGDVLRELDRDLGIDVRRRPLLVISVIGVQSSGKSTLMNYLFGCSFQTHVGRCTKGLYISLLETKRELVVVLDTEGLLSVEARDDVFDKQVALMTMACSDLVIVNNRGELGRHVGDLFQVCLFALYHLKLARISPAIGFVLQCLSMVNQQQQYEWVATVKKSLEESVQELQQTEKPGSFKLQDLVFLDSESIFVMPSAFNDDVQFGLQVSRPTNLYALKALQLREKVFHWITRAKASHKQRLRETAGASPPTPASPSTPSRASASVSAPDAQPLSFASLSQWYEHARTVWQTLSMCGTDLLQFRTMRHVLMAQQLQEFCDALVVKYIDERLSQEAQDLIEKQTEELNSAAEAKDVHVIDNAFRGQLDMLRDAILQQMHHEFNDFVKLHDTKFTDEQVKSDKKFSLMGPMRRKYASVDSLWRSRVHLALEQRSMDTLFDDISQRVTELLVDQGANVNVQNVEGVFEEKWNQVMAETMRKQRPNLAKVVQEVVWHFNAALTNLKSQFRKAHIFHGVKSLSVHELGSDAEICASFLHTKKGFGDALVPSGLNASVGGAKMQVDNLWIKLVDAMRLEVDRQGQMSDATALKILNRLNSEMEVGDHLRHLMHSLGSGFIQRIFFEIARATMHYRFQIEQQNFQSRVTEVLGKKQQKLWEIQARVDMGKRDIHCAKVWAKTFVDALDKHFRNAVCRMAQEIVSHMSNILTNPANACELAIERSFTKRNWRHVVMYAIDPTQYLYMEFHKEWEQFKQGLVDQYCRELKNNFGSCLRIAEENMESLLHSQLKCTDMTMNRVTEVLKEKCSALADDSIAAVMCSSLPSFVSDSDWSLKSLEQFAQFAIVELRRYRANTKSTEQSVERRMDAELINQKANCWKCICGCPHRCPGCGTKCNLESENHWPERPHECRRHLYPAFNGWQKQEGRKPFLLHCRARAQWQIARTRPPIEPGGRERYWDNFQEMLEDEHPDWLDPATRLPLPSMAPLEEYEEDCTRAPDSIQREIEENRRAWANCKDALLEHFTSMADDQDIEWLEKYKREGGALTAEDFATIRDELFEVTPLESLEAFEHMVPVDEASIHYDPAI